MRKEMSREQRQRFIDLLLDFMVKNPHLFVNGIEDESNNVVTKCNSDIKEVSESYLTLS
ncbi:hypothetical protein P9Z80_14400 [Bacillus cereus]|nr:hypothetical protein [Bacillus cereus]MEC3259007.1 hypothetical protein [Bacillus cereus]